MEVPDVNHKVQENYMLRNVLLFKFLLWVFILPTCKPAGGRRGGEQPGRRSLEGVGGVMGAVGKFLVSLFSFSTKKSVFDHLGARDWMACLYQFLADQYLEASKSSILVKTN